MVNKVILIGHVGIIDDLNLNNLKINGENDVVKFSLATSYRSKIKNINETLWHKVVCFSKQAAICKKYLKKGMKVYVEGKLSYSSWVGTEGIKRTKTEIICNTIQFLSKKDDDKESESDLFNIQPINKKNVEYEELKEGNNFPF